jgi:hypothetical protein
MQGKRAGDLLSSSGYWTRDSIFHTRGVIRYGEKRRKEKSGGGRLHTRGGIRQESGSPIIIYVTDKSFPSMMVARPLSGAKSYARCAACAALREAVVNAADASSCAAQYAYCRT